jgi:hypothetical protein
LTSPLCLNFLSLIHMDSHVIKSQILETRYTQVMGHMDVISIVSDYFNIYFPMVLVGLSLATYFSFGAKLLTGESQHELVKRGDWSTVTLLPAIGFQQFLDQESEMTQELVEEGKEHMKREKRRILRLMEASTSRKSYTDRSNEGFSATAADSRHQGGTNFVPIAMGQAAANFSLSRRTRLEVASVGGRWTLLERF